MSTERRPDLTCLTVAEVASRLQVTRKTVYRLVRRGELPAHRIGGVVRITEDALALYLQATRVSPPIPHSPTKVKRRVRPVPSRPFRYFP